MVIITGGKQRKSSQGKNVVFQFNSTDDFATSNLSYLYPGALLRTNGYHRIGDGGGAEYLCDYVIDLKEVPWAIPLIETDEIDYEIKQDNLGNLLKDKNGNYIPVTDSDGAPVPKKDANGNVKHKMLYALLNEKVINYRMFGAALDGITDDYEPIRQAHLYQSSHFTIEPISERKHYYIKLENHEGIIRKDNNEPIQCCGNIDLSGSELYIQDSNSAWFGFYLWGDNETDFWTYEPTEAAKTTYKKDNFVINTDGKLSSLKQNALITLKEDPYAVRDDAGYLYTEPRYELLLHTTDGVLANPITYDWSRAGGLEVKTALSNYDSHSVTTQTVNTHFSISYNMLPSSHYEFVGCNVKLATTANKYCSVLWVKCHNAHVRGFTFYPDTNEMHNTVFKNTMIYIWGSYNVEVSNINGFNAAGKMKGGSNGTSGYMIRATNCLNLHLHDISMQGYWGATAMNCVKDVHIERVNANRLDIHNYFQNLYIDHCNLYNHAIQIGEGRGICQITNSNFYVNNLPNDSYPNAHILEFNTTYGRIFEGRVLIQNCDAWIKDPGGQEFDVCKIDFNANAVSTLDTHKFPEVTVRDCNFHSYAPDTYLVYFMVAGKRNCCTAAEAPTIAANGNKDTGNDDKGTLGWEYIDRGIDWTESFSSITSVKEGQFIRTFDNAIDSDNKTAFFNTKMFLVTKGGTIPAISESTKPTDTSGKEFTLGTATIKYVEWHEWQANRLYSVGDYCYTTESFWEPVHCWKCNSAGRSNGWRPVHTSGKVIEGEDVYPKNLDACYWQYIGTKSAFVTKTFSPKMVVSKDDILYADHRLYKVLQGGQLLDVPPRDTAWHGSFDYGTARLGFIGKDWAPQTWWEKNSYCISLNDKNVECIYQLVDQDGTTSGAVPVRSNSRCIDGDIMWEWVDAKGQGSEWKPNTSYNVGDLVHWGVNTYKCIFDGKLEMPSQIILENITTNMKNGGDVFAFWESGTDIPTKGSVKGEWVIKVDNVDFYRFRTFSKGYFCHEGNPMPTIIQSNSTGTTISRPSSEPTPTPSQTDTTGDVTPTQPSETTPEPKADPGVTVPTDGKTLWQKTLACTANKPSENWDGNADYMFTVPAGHSKVLIKAESSVADAVISPSTYLCFVDSEWTKQVQVTNIGKGAVVNVTPGKQYCFAYWVNANKDTSITLSITADAEIDLMTTTFTQELPTYM